MILVIPICETCGYVVTWRSCASASAADANMGNDPPLVLIHRAFRLGLTSGFRLRMILVIPICETGGYVVIRSSCPSASAADANVGNDPPLVLIHRASRFGLTTGLRLRLILVIPICETGGYVVIRSSCPSASAADANVGNDPPLVLIHHTLWLGLTSDLRLRMILVILYVRPVDTYSLNVCVHLPRR
jgi:hypothetical protein